MALIEFDVYKQKLRELSPELDKLSAALDIESAQQEAERLEAETAMDGFWNDLARSQKVQMRLKQLQNKIGRYQKLVSSWEDLTVLCEMGQEAEDEDILEEVKTEFAALEEKVEELTEVNRLVVEELKGERKEEFTKYKSRKTGAVFGQRSLKMRANVYKG